MEIPKASDLIIDAFQTSGVRGIGQAVTAEDTDIGLRFLNLHLIPQLRLQRLWSPSVTEYNFTTTNNTSSYSIGLANPIITEPQPDIVVNQEIIQILQSQVNVGNVWVPLSQMSPEDFYRMTLNDSITNIPSQFMYNRTRNPFDELVFTNPNLAGYNVRIAVNGEVKAYELDDDVNLPSGMYAGLLYGLSELIAEYYGLTEKARSLNSKFSSALMRIKEVTGAPVPRLNNYFSISRYDINSDSIVNGGL
jgi:hypothetical protein